MKDRWPQGIRCYRAGPVTDTPKTSLTLGSQGPFDVPPPDNEFSHIPTPRRRSPVIAVAAAALAIFLAVRLRKDVVFALSSADPTDVGLAVALAARDIGTVPANRVVRVSGMPDRESAVILDTQGSWEFSQFFRMRGTQNRLFVRRMSDPLPLGLLQKDSFVGRLMPFDDLSLSNSIRKHFSQRVTATHFIAPAALHAALVAGGSIKVLDLTGESISLAPADHLTVDVLRPGELRLEAPRERFPSLAALKALVEEKGGTLLGPDTTSTAADRFTVAVSFPPDRRAAALSALGDIDRRMRFRPARTTHKVRVDALGAAPDRLLIKGGALSAIGLADVAAVQVLAPVEIPAQAWLLLEGERPRDHLPKLLILAFLLAFATVNLVGLRRS